MKMYPNENLKDRIGLILRQLALKEPYPVLSKHGNMKISKFLIHINRTVKIKAKFIVSL